MSSAAQSEVKAVLDALATGNMPSEAMIVALSDLGREEAALVRQHWASLPIVSRTAAMTIATALAHSRVDLDFLRLAHIVLELDTNIARRAALAAVEGRGGSEMAVRIAAVLAGESDGAVLAAAAEAAAPYMLQLELGELDEDAEQLAQELRRLLTGEAAFDVHTHALRALGPLSREWVEEAIRDAYYSDEPLLRLAAIDAMGNSANVDWFEYLEESITSEDPQFRVAVAKAYATIGDEAGVDAVAELLEDEDLDVVAAAMNALAEIGGEEAVDHLQRFRARVPEELEGQLEEASELANFDIERMRPPQSSFTEDDDE